MSDKKIKSFKLKRLSPKLHPVNLKKRVGKAILWGIIPIEPIIEILILPASLFLKKILRKEENEGWIEFKGGKLFITNKEISEIEEFEIKEIESLKIHFCLNLNIDADADVVDENLFKQGISRIEFKSRSKDYQYFYDCKKKEILKLCDFLYNNGVIFKEFNNGKRVFMGKQPKYSEVQKLKKQYNIEW